MAPTSYLVFLCLLFVLAPMFVHTYETNDPNEEKRLLVMKHLREHVVVENFGNAVLKWLGFEEQFINTFTQTLTDEDRSSLSYNDALLVKKLRQNESKCFEDMLTVAVATEIFADFALEMLDAEGKQPSGVLEGNARWLGNYDQCLRQKATYAPIPHLNSTLVHDFDAKYCAALYVNAFAFPGIFAQKGFCVPDTCNEEDLWGYINDNLPLPESLLMGIVCSQPKELANDGRAIAATTVLSAFGALVLLATITDYGLRVSKAKTKTNQIDVSNTVSQNGGNVEDAIASNSNGSTSKIQTAGAVEKDTVGENRIQSFEVDEAVHIEQLKPNKCVQLVLSFSLYSTLPRVLSAKAPKGSFTCMNGIRFLSMSWIVLGHTWKFGNIETPVSPYFTAENLFGQFRLTKRFTHDAINYMDVAVESFFVLRLTPVYMIILMAYTCLVDMISNGPSSPSPPDLFAAATCRNNWWKNLLYLNNFMMDEECMFWTWYMANEFQFYVIAPLFIFLLYRWPVVGGPFLGLAWGGTIAATGYIKTLVAKNERDNYIDYYSKPWCRFAPYALGIFLGFIMFKTKCKKKIHWSLVVVGWIVAGFFMMVAVYGGHNRGVGDSCDNCNEWSVQMDAMFFTLYRSLFAAGVCWMIYACCSGYGGVIDTILSWKGFIPLSKLCYVSYLIHPIIIYFVYYNNRRIIYVDDMNMIMYYGSFLLYTCAVAFVITLVFEVPFLLMEAVIIPRNK